MAIRFPLLVALAATLACATTPRGAAERAPARTILFVGNSFTYGDAAGGPDVVRPFGRADVTDLNGDSVGGVPALFAHFARQAGLDWSVSVETRPGTGLDFHYRERLAVVARPWDVVVLQGYSTLDARRPGDPTTLVRYAGLLADTLRALNPRVRIHLVATWSRADMTYQPSGHWYGKPIDAMAHDVEAGYELARSRSPHIAGVIPVGAAWSRAIAAGVADANPYDGVDGGTVNLWAPDAYHASAFGSYLSALVNFGAITGVDPRTLGAGETAARSLGITPAQATALQAVAWEELAGRR